LIKQKVGETILTIICKQKPYIFKTQNQRP
jgi:hypothetical protein